MAEQLARIPASGTLRELGPISWVIARLGARTIRAPRFHLFDTLGKHTVLFLTFLPYSHILLNWGKLTRRDAELVILRVGHLRNSEYELQQHRRLARSRGVDDATQAKIFEGPQAAGLTDRQRALLTAVDEFVLKRSITDDAWASLAEHLDDKQMIELCLLAGHYDTIAATIASVRVPLDFPD